MKNRGEFEVYVDFLTNLAVAWFTAGIIAPLFTPIGEKMRILSYLMAVSACFISLKLAVFFKKGKK